MTQARATLASAALLALLVLMPPASAASAVAGTGQGSTFSFCNPNVSIVMAGASPDGATWAFELTMLRSPADGCAPVAASAYAGAWSPLAGGCMPSVAPQGSQLCVDAVALPGPAPTRWRICSLATDPCIDFTAFWTGAVSLAGS